MTDNLDNPYKLLTSTEATARAVTFFNYLGCTSGTYKRSLVCAKAKTSSQILAAYEKINAYMISQGKLETELYLPVIDNIMYSKSIPELSALKAFKKCSIMTGYNANEASLFVIGSYNILGSDLTAASSVAASFDFQQTVTALYKLLKYTPIYPYRDPALGQRIFAEYFNYSIDFSPKEFLGKISHIFSDVQYNCQATQLASFYAKRGLKAYVYEYGYNMQLG